MIGDSLYAAHDLGVDRIGEETLPQLTHSQSVDPIPTAPGRAGRRRPYHLRTGRAHGFVAPLFREEGHYEEGTDPAGRAAVGAGRLGPVATRDGTHRPRFRPHQGAVDPGAPARGPGRLRAQAIPRGKADKPDWRLPAW